ncbi:MAG: RecQ family ATP-dependent DNA helicase [Candidatus Koribacter versatilis]|uniref:ATP-dependent DNA helicase RecQ n=1 Tax=Candidatus Korobacter versatilis TaxID=658062 RepID=A0A932A6H3_9BACT|nr:RecQ family ATP-dependent DNA helicase [Candidatus Koribacter versatilis]
MSVLERYWGYSTFRPMQERIVASLLGGRDACVVMPTGGGKSLCYQLPAAVSEGRTVIVVSPLIALMQDQVVQLTAMGIPAAFLNSSLESRKQPEIMAKAAHGGYRLLYLSPERLARPDTFAWLERVPISLFAIDEAHCISEWGHEFRPDYRQLKRLRQHFPERPLAAFTASATRRVRHDIIEQLGLRAPDKYIASFHRANLNYLVMECAGETEQTERLLAALRAHPSGNIIVYAPTIKRVEQTVAELAAEGVVAVPYNAKLPAEERRRNQERWMSDDVRVLVGTVAFGLGINKAAVRAVIHLALPKSVEQFYQEAGRAGRDGLPADCLLLWQRRDSGLHGHFIAQIQDAGEKERAWKRYSEVQDFVARPRCRHRQVCLHFGETPKWQECQGCDVCSGLPAWLKTDNGFAPTRSARLGFATAANPQGAVPDEQLKDYLREWRRKTAADQGVPAFVVMHDTTLDELCRARPTTLAEVRAVAGIGEKKLATYGRGLLDAMRRYQEGARAAERRVSMSLPERDTLRCLREGRSLAEIAALRARTVGTIAETVAALIERGETEVPDGCVDVEKRRAIEEQCARLGTERLRPLKDALPEEISFDEIRVVVASVRRAKESGGRRAV